MQCGSLLKVPEFIVYSVFFVFFLNPNADFMLKVKLSAGAVPLKRELLVKFALKVHRCCPAVYADVGGS